MLSTKKQNRYFNVIDCILARHVEAGLNDKVAVIDEKNELTYGELLAKIKGFSHYAPEILLLPKESVVACVFDDSIDSVIVFISLIYHGLIPCNINPQINPSAYDLYFKSISAKLILIDEKYHQKFEKYIRNNSILHSIIKNKDINSLSYQAQNAYLPFHNTHDDTSLFCIFTSGTTGHPSAIIHRHKDVIIMNENYASTILKVKQNDVIFTSSKMYFAYGINSLFIALYHGATAILSPRNNDSASVWTMIKYHEPTIFFSVPTMYNKLLEDDNACGIDWNINFISAGEPLPEKILNRWRKKFTSNIIDGIGCTEVLSTFISNTPDQVIAKSAGKPVKGFRCVIKDQNGNELGNNEIGVLWIYGDTYPVTYLNNENSTKDRFVNGWYNTNDLFYKDDNGFYYHQGRVNDLIYKNGVWVFPARIEDRIHTIENVLESIVLDCRSNHGNVELIAFVVVNGNIKPKELYQSIVTINEESPYYQPEEKISVVCLVDNIPKTYTGKNKRFELKKLNIWDQVKMQIKRSQNKVFDLHLDMRGKCHVS